MIWWEKYTEFEMVCLSFHISFGDISFSFRNFFPSMFAFVREIIFLICKPTQLRKVVYFHFKALLSMNELFNCLCSIIAKGTWNWIWKSLWKQFLSYQIVGKIKEILLSKWLGITKLNRLVWKDILLVFTGYKWRIDSL